jgi:hypothetical protein
MVFGNFRIDQFAAQRFEAFEGAFLVDPHQPRIARHVSSKNGGQPAFDAFPSQAVLPNRMGRINYRLSGRILTVNATAAIAFR